MEVQEIKVIKMDPAEMRRSFIQELRRKFKAGEGHLSFSSIKRFKKCPTDFISYKMEAKKSTDAMTKGNAVDCYVLTNHLFKRKFITDTKVCEKIGGAKPRATTAYKEWRAAVRSDLTVLDQEDYDKYVAMGKAVLSNPAAMAQLNKCPHRQKLVEFEHNGVKWRGYIDADGDVVIDLKTLTDAEPKAIMRDIVKMDYWLQAGIYTVGNDSEMKPYFIIGVDANCNVGVVEIDENFINFGIATFERLAREFNECVELDQFDQSYEYRSPTAEGYHIMSKPPYLS